MCFVGRILFQSLQDYAHNAPVAQLVVQRTLNPLVRGSNPCRCTDGGSDVQTFPLSEGEAFCREWR
jgi:hypothetical protein